MVVLEGSPANKSFSGPGITNTVPGFAEFDPVAANVGDHEIIYWPGGGNEQRVTVHVVDLPPTTLDPFTDVCEGSAAFALTGGSPAGGTYSGTGVDGFGNFDPAVAGTGYHTITYTVTSGGCNKSASQDIYVRPLPLVDLAPFATVCEDEAAFALSGGNPAGGTYSGTGVSANTFDPAASGTGTFAITYTYSDGVCINSDTEDLTVAPLPVVSITDLDATYCQSDPAETITGTPTDANGVFTGTGITDNGNGTALFDPAAAGNGTFTITYTYTSADGCTNSTSQDVQVGTPLTLSGLDPGYCVDAAAVNIVATPSGGSYVVFPGLTDNGGGDATFDPATAGVGTYTVEYQYLSGGCLNTIDATVEVYALPTPSIHGFQADYCINEPIDLISGNYAPDGTFSGDGITDNGDGTADFDPASLPAGGPYTIYYAQTDANGCYAQTSETTTINPLPTATITGDATICYGDATSIQIDFTGTTPYDFAYTNGTSTTNISNHAPDLYTTNVSPLTNTSYTMVSVTDDNGCTNSGNGSADVVVNPLVTIDSHPVDKTVCQGSNTSFSVNASGVDLTYQWQLNGAPIGGATNPTLTLNNVLPGDVGDYTCIVSSSCGGPLTSDAATLSLFEDVTITAQPQDDNLCTGEDLNLFVSATGSNLTYQWKKDNVDIAGATSATYTKSSVTSLDAGIYTCYVGGSCSPYESDPAIITVDEPIVISDQPANTVVCEGEHAGFSVTASGTNLTYQWQKNAADIAGEENASLILNGVVAGDAGTYRCIISSPCGETLTSSNANLTVDAATSITTQPVASITQCVGTNLSLDITATGTNLTYQWKKGTADLVNGGNVSGAQSSNLFISGVDLTDDGVYSCEVTGTCGSEGSNFSDVTIMPGTAISQHPADYTVIDGGNASFSVQADGSSLTYQWQKDGEDIFDGGIISGATTATLSRTGVSDADEGNYHCIV
ncbi:MAG: immunoglobulin domain-containing protein, partial [Mariniphaga sp.]